LAAERLDLGVASFFGAVFLAAVFATTFLAGAFFWAPFGLVDFSAPSS